MAQKVRSIYPAIDVHLVSDFLTKFVLTTLKSVGFGLFMGSLL